jgi:putative resolvase
LTPEKIYANISNIESPVGINEAAKAIGVSVDSLRRWERKGKITSERTIGGHRRYVVGKLRDEIAAMKNR